MSIHLRIAFSTLLGLVVGGFTLAGCPESRTISTFGPGGYSYLYTPGVPGGAYADFTVSSQATGFFWALGFGAPALGVGIDNGSLPALRADHLGWIRDYPGYAAFIDADWAEDPGIDGCIDDAQAPRCTAVLISDQNQGSGYFAYLTQAVDANGDAFIGEGTDMPLGKIPKPSIVGSRSISSTIVEVDLAPPSVNDGLFADPACPSAEPIGYRIYEQQVPRGASPPDDRALDAGWAVAQNGAEPGGGPIPLSTPRTVTLFCPIQSDVRLVTQLVFESGFATEFVSENSTRIECGNCTQNDDLDADCGSNFDDCDDANPTVYRGAPQLCDGVNNDCSDPTWPTPPLDELDQDFDGVSTCSGDCDDSTMNVYPGATEVCDGLDNDCDLLTDEDLDGEDSDADGIANLCDNCPQVTNHSQSDLDGDGEGDSCDLDDEFIRTEFDAQSALIWQQETGYSAWNLYRGDLLFLLGGGAYTQPPGSNSLAARQCSLTTPDWTDTPPIDPGGAAFYLVTGTGVEGESHLGVTSEGSARPNLTPCP